MTAALEKAVADGRTTPGAPLKNDAEVVIFKKSPQAKATQSKGGKAKAKEKSAK